MSKTTIIAKNIKKYRKEKELSQDKFVRLADVAHTTIIKIESDKIQSPTIDTVQKIVKALGVGLEDLMRNIISIFKIDNLKLIPIKETSFVKREK